MPADESRLAAANAAAMEILRSFYPEETPLRTLLLKHSTQVRDKALDILRRSSAPTLCDDADVVQAALLHDIGVGRCHAPSILCEGHADYMAHGLIGGQMLREYAISHHIDLEKYARVCERHTGTGLTSEDIRTQRLPLPERDFLPETPLERLICLADKFYSKSGDMQEKPLPRVRASLAKFGPDTLARFDALCRRFAISSN